jgi:hypothetical protein
VAEAGEDRRAAQVTLDQTLLRTLSAETQRLLAQARDPSDGKIARYLQSRVELLGALSELFLERPTLTASPGALLFLRACGPMFFADWVGFETVSDVELSRALTAIGAPPEFALAFARGTAEPTWAEPASTIPALAEAVEATMAPIYNPPTQAQEPVAPSQPGADGPAAGA